MTLPPLMSRLGAKFSQEVQWASVFHALRFGPTSASTVWMVITLMPSMVVVFTPKMRSSSACRSKAGWFPMGLRGLPDRDLLLLPGAVEDAAGGAGIAA